MVLKININFIFFEAIGEKNEWTAPFRHFSELRKSPFCGTLLYDGTRDKARLYRKGIFMSDYEKYQQIKREAGWTGLALFVLIGFWLAAGFGLSGMEGEVFGLPIWAVTSSLGVWFFAIVLVRLLTSFVFRDMELDEDAAGEGDVHHE